MEGRLQKVKAGTSLLKRLETGLCFIAAENSWRCNVSTGHLLLHHLLSLLSDNKQNVGLRSACPGEAVWPDVLHSWRGVD